MSTLMNVDTDLPPAAGPEPQDPVGRPLRGFAALDPALRRILAKKGGVAAHRSGSAHEFTPEEARIAGRKGGLAKHRDPPAPESKSTP